MSSRYFTQSHFTKDGKEYFFTDGILINSQESDNIRIKALKERKYNQEIQKQCLEKQRIDELKERFLSLLEENEQSKEIDISNLYREYHDVIQKFDQFLNHLGYTIRVKPVSFWNFYSDTKAYLVKYNEKSIIKKSIRMSKIN